MLEKALIKYATTLSVIKLQFSVKINKIKHKVIASFLRIVYGVKKIRSKDINMKFKCL